MKKNRLTILAINPGTRYIGIAILQGTILIDWSVKVIDGNLSEGKLKKSAAMIGLLIEHYQPDILVLKKLHPSRSSVSLDRLCHSIEAIAAINGVRLEQYSIQEVEQFFAPGIKMNKTRLAELVCKQHPVLRHDLNREQNNCNPYYVRMFEAVALGTMTRYRLMVQ